MSNAEGGNGEVSGSSVGTVRKRASTSVDLGGAECVLVAAMIVRHQSVLGMV